MSPRTLSLAVLTIVLAAGACDAKSGHRTVATFGVPSTTATTEPPTTTTTAPPPPPTAVAAGTGEFADAAAAAAAIADSVTRRHDPSTADGDIAALARKEQAAYRATVFHAGWTPAVLARLPASVRPVADANLTAGAELVALLTKLPTALPPWRIVAPAPVAELRGYYNEAEAATGISWAYIAAIHLVETRMGRIRGTSTAGAQGPMQFMPATFARYGEGDINDNRQSILAAGRLLKANGGPADMHAALLRYNHSEHYVRAVTLYARQMLADPSAYRAYYEWQVYYHMVTGDVLLPVGYGAETSP
jgi:membrane-bound lytic murein transglycosylase B